MALNGCGLKNDAILDTFYEEFGRRYRTDKSYAIYFFHGSYDVPLKAGDKESLWESEEVYQFLVCAVCPVNSDYEPGKPEWGFCSRHLRTGAAIRIGSMFLQQTEN